MAYFDTIHNASTFQEKALSKKGQKTKLNRQARGTRRAPLPLLEPYLVNETPSRPDIQALIGGPVLNLQVLPMLSDAHFVLGYGRSGIGFVWAQLGALLQRQGDEDNQEQEEPRAGGTKSRRNQEQEEPRAGGDMENPQGTGVEDTEIDDLTLHLARFFVRVVLIWSQQLYIQLPDEQAVAETRVERVSANYQLQSGSNCILWAVEDGGVRLLSLPGLKDSRIVALMETKQRFQDLEDGKPVISDGLLAQMAGQALLVLLDKRRRTIFDTR
ncbi:predicted protein [Chaetomium globosum CBS 148.51]|uniref:Uncharacterized protein n=1 Tax=Chaetomium globosum (strain ATCC 6205 / CBS 148.51 / DSM 1962 / NBRC 6347 / NRRL 1970) TaxID=306901 RepID=Q2HE50_CHAGB|nr:uncharacterized protein CHGG_01504 [Chaetomium globosum CBS 148.51]EAQ93269.1 predicted protein [Chaetomium globosum CBS 148.51]